MLKWIKNVFNNFLKKREGHVPGYLGRDLSKHRVHATKYEDLCKQCVYDGADIGFDRC